MYSICMIYEIINLATTTLVGKNIIILFISLWFSS